MSKKLKIDPLTRIEGHLKISVEEESSTVKDAKVHGEMYRGFEKILHGRHPFDAARITQRVCGICHEVHGVASVKAIESLYKVDVPFNGLILRDLILGLHIITDHIIHFYNLCLPDYVDFNVISEYSGTDRNLLKIKELITRPSNPFLKRKENAKFIRDKDLCIRMVRNYFKAIDVRSKAASGLAILGAKTPFCHALLPGGITTDVTLDSLYTYHKVLEETADFVIQDYYEDVQILCEYFPEYFGIGSTYDRFFGYESLSMNGEPLFKEGVLSGSNLYPLDYSKISERLVSSYYDDEGKPHYGKNNAYSWIKAPRYDGLPMETGPIARLLISHNKTISAETSKYYKGDVFSSTMSRLLARVVECKIILRYLFDLVSKYRPGDDNIITVDPNQKITGSAFATSIAARGDLMHKISAVDGRIDEYNMVMPSTWNFGPSTESLKGIVEKALIGVKSSDDASIKLQAERVVRSFDPCTACSIH